MSMARAKENLERLLADNEIRVMALSGNWGTGKSHMWNSLRDASPDSAIKTALYVSLFGVASIAELKLKLNAYLILVLPPLRWSLGPLPVNLIAQSG